MRVKESLPWTIESPVIQLVQPSPAAPLGHALVLDRPVVPLHRREQAEMITGRQGRHKESNKKNRNLNCDYYSPSIHQLSESNKRNQSFYDLRNKRPASVDVGLPSEKATYVARSKSLDESTSLETSLESRKTSPNFEEILQDLCCDLKKNASNESSVITSPSGASSIVTGGKGSSSDSVFYDVALDEISTESSNETVPADFNPRKSFSEDTFDRHRKQLAKQRNRLIEKATTKSRTTSSDSCDEGYEDIWKRLNPQVRRRVSQMLDDLLLEIYRDKSTLPVRRRSCMTMGALRQGTAGQDNGKTPSHVSAEENSYNTENTSGSDTWRYSCLQFKSIADLRETRRALQAEVRHLGGRLVRQLCRRDCLIARRDWHCDWITAYLQANSEKRSEDTKTRFSVAPSHGDSGFTQWQNGMRMVARLPEGIPPQFRRTLWLNLAEKHLTSRGIQWQQVEEFCFNEFTNPDDEELGIQIVKDVHRTGCSLFCGVSGKDNQALLKRVLLAYARWNKAVGYCQGFNMLAALILQVMDRSEVDAVKVMIYLIEGVLPESYFANNLRGLSVDMAVFRDLLRIKLPTLSRHFDQLQIDSKDSGTSYEPPLTNVFTMQWFLTLFCNCLPQETVLRVWDLIFLEGNHVLLATALAIWSTLADRILSVESADEFYCIMGVLTREMLEFGLMDANALIKAIVSFNLSELPELRERYLYNITPWTHSVSTVARRGLRLFYSDDDTDTEEDDDKIAIATAYGLFKSPKKKDGSNEVVSPPRALACPDKEKIAMDISALTKQYRKLRERQKQAHVILTAACGSQSLVTPTSPAMNHLLMGKFALINNKGRRLGPPPGAIPPPSGSKSLNVKTNTPSGETLHWKDTMTATKGDENSPVSSPVKDYSRRSSSSSSTSTELCDDPQRMSDSEDQTNSLSESYVLPDVSGCSPLKPLQGKTPHSLDVESCREDCTEPSITIDSVVTNNSGHNELEFKEDSPILLTPEGEDEKPQQKRKPSFKIDPEELRQLDRKLSLKIVEIERRKSSAGIESDDLNSVLFSFDRDYIQEVERTERESPSSIPDDRLCSTDDFICGLEESYTIPDLITTHKPINYRMTSLEECDETNDSETNGNLLDGDERCWDDCMYTKSSLDSDAYDENQDDFSVIEVNYDDLFAQSSDYIDKISNNSSNNLENVNKQSFEQVDCEQNITLTEAGHKDENISMSFTSESVCPILNQVILDEEHETSAEHYIPVNISQENDECEISSSNKNSSYIFNLSKQTITTDFSESFKNEEDRTYVPQQPSQGTKTDLEKKLAKLLPTIASSTYSDSSPPNFTSLNSSDGCIKSIKEKYANFPQSSIDITDAAIVLDETNKFLSKLNLCCKNNESHFVSDDHKLIPQEVGSLSVTLSQEREVVITESPLHDIEIKSDSSYTNTEISYTKPSLQRNFNSLSQVEASPPKEEEIDRLNYKTENFQPDMIIQKESPKRRGSEVALSLILKENSQILTKIHQQSRRSSEICIERETIPEGTGYTEYKNETTENHPKTDSVFIKNAIKTSDNLDNTNECQNVNDLLENTIETEQLNCYPHKEHYVNTPYLLKENSHIQSDDHDEKKTSIITNYIKETPDNLFALEDRNSFTRSCLPDLCNLDEKTIPNIRTKQLEHSAAFITNSESLYSYPESEKVLEYSDNTETEPNYVKEKYVSSPTIKEKENITHHPKPIFKGDDRFDHNTYPYKPNNRGNLQYSSNTLFRVGDKAKNEEEAITNVSVNNKVLDTNEDILEELRSLDIEPDEVLDYFDPENITHTTYLPNKSNKRIKKNEESPDSMYASENDHTLLSKCQLGGFSYSSFADNEDISDNRSIGLPTSSKTVSSSVLYNKQKSFDYSTEWNASSVKSKFNAHKSYSVDTISHDKISSVNFVADTSKTKYCTDLDQDKILTIDGDNYRKSFMVNSELNTQKGSNDFINQCGIASSLENVGECAYSLKRTKSPIENITSSRQSRFSDRMDFGNREKLLIKYKSEDFSERTSPTHYRFSSASPIRKSLTSSSHESSIHSSVNADRAKSSSPIPDVTLNRQNLCDKYSACATQESECRGTKDVKRYHRAESLDLNPNKDDLSKIMKKKAESFESFPSSKVWKEKKSPTSPVKFNPFPARSYSRQPRDLGVKLGLYLPAKTEKSPTKHLT